MQDRKDDAPTDVSREELRRRLREKISRKKQAAPPRNADIATLMMQSGIDDAALLQMGMQTSKPTMNTVKKLVQEVSKSALAADAEEAPPPVESESDDEAPPKDDGC